MTRIEPSARPAPSGDGSPDDARRERDRHLAALLASAAHGDATAFEAFFDASAGYARALARRIVAGADLDDALADAYFDAWRRAEQFDPQRGSAITWLLNIVRCRALDLLRRRPPATANRGGETDPADCADDDASTAADLLWRSESQARLHHALATLSPSERWVLGLAYFREMPHSEIAAATGMPLGSVKSLILRAQHKLRDRLAA